MRLPAVKSLVALNVLVYLLQGVGGAGMETAFALWPLGDGAFHPWQLVTYAFLHDTGNVTHLLFNMLALWMFGTQVEYELGTRRFLACYFASVVTAAVSQLTVPALFGEPPAPTIGASGGVFGLLLAYALLFPNRKVIPLIPPIPMPAWLFATLYAAVELLLGITGRFAGVAHFAHLGGMVGAAIVVLSRRRMR